MSRPSDWHVIAFLEHAHHVGILRQAGGVYEFRRARLQEALAGRNGAGACTAAPAPALEPAATDASPRSPR